MYALVYPLTKFGLIVGVDSVVSILLARESLPPRGFDIIENSLYKESNDKIEDPAKFG